MCFISSIVDIAWTYLQQALLRLQFQASHFVTTQDNQQHNQKGLTKEAQPCGFLFFLFPFQVSVHEFWNKGRPTPTPGAYSGDLGYPQIKVLKNEPPITNRNGMETLHYLISYMLMALFPCTTSMYSRTCLTQCCWDRGVGIELGRVIHWVILTLGPGADIY